MMTIHELASALDPIAHAALTADDQDVKRVSIILAAVMGCIGDGDDPIDWEALMPLVISAGLICEHRTGRHQH